MGKIKGVEYAVSAHGTDRYFSDGTDALISAAEMAMNSGSSRLDVMIYSEAGAKAYGGDDAVEAYLEDPDASVFERFEFKCNAVGRVP